MYIALVNASTDPEITPPLVERYAHALQTQLYRDFGPACQVAGFEVEVFPSLAELPDDDEASPLVIFDDGDQSGALGWHSVDPRGRAFGRAFWRVLKQYGASLTDGANSLGVTLSHEALEMNLNPYVTGWYDMPNGVQEAMEACDRVEADAYKEEGTGIYVSNFLRPRAFRDGDGPYDFMQLLRSPWEIRPGGYAIRRVGSRVENVWGQAYPDWKKPMKMHPASRTARRIASVEQLTPVGHGG